MQPGASAEDVGNVVARVEAAGGEAFVSRGVTRTIIGLVGDIEPFAGLEPARDARRRRRDAGLRAVQAGQPRPTTRRCRPCWSAACPSGPDTFTLIAGPCAVETPQQTLEAAEMAKAAGATLLRGGAYKPRTSPYAFQGLGEAGLKILADVRRGHRAAGGDRGGRPARRRPGALVRRHAPGRHPQHGELRPAAGGRPVRQAGDAQARHAGDHRGVADGRGVHRPARQPRHRAVRARHPDLRERRPATPWTSARCRSRTRSRTCR